MEGRTVKYKSGKIAPPDTYLGARLNRNIINGNMCWNITSYDYVITAMQTIKDVIKQNPWKTPKTADTPMTKSFVLELYGNEELGPDGIQF